MELYDYEEAVKSDIEDYINEYYDKEELIEKLDEWDDFEQKLYDILFVEDYVTGNASGSYTCNARKAEEYLCHNLDLLADAFDEFCCDNDILRIGAEACDVTIRCYLLGQCLSDVLEEIKDELEEELEDEREI